jgi:septum formation inhibitor-activating ATPase MinD
MQDAYLGDCRVKQVVIGDSKQPNCYFLPTFNCTSAKFIDECVESLDGLFDYIICDGIAKNSCNSAYVITQPYPATFNSANYCICKLKDDGFDDVSLIVNMAKGSLIRDGYTPSPCDIAELLHVKLLAIIPEDTGLCINSPKRSTLKAFDMAAKSIYKNSDKMFKLESCDKKLLFNRQRQVTL